jgi:LAO/AO transport system kinase
MGDDIQALKAGILEVADLLVINKADRDGASRTYQDLLMMLDLQAHRRTSAWKPKIFMTQALENQGIADLMAGVEEHREFLAQEGGEALLAARRARVKQEFLELLKEGMHQHLVRQLSRDGRLDEILQDILERRTDPYSASEALVVEILGDV